MASRKHGALPPASFIGNNGVRYFHQEWLEDAIEEKIEREQKEAK